VLPPEPAPGVGNVELQAPGVVQHKERVAGDNS
jgi:hypothetical protein